MKIENLEQKLRVFEKVSSSIKSNLGSYLLAPTLALGIAALGTTSCGGPSDYCCGTLQCEDQGQVCDGEDDECYCREKNCCERTECGYDHYCSQDTWGDSCGCVPDVDYGDGKR